MSATLSNDSWSITILDRFNLEPISIIPANSVRRGSFQERLYGTGHGELTITISDEILEQGIYDMIVDGGIIEFTREWYDPFSGENKTWTYIGYPETMSTQTERGTKFVRELGSIINEIVVIGEGSGATRKVFRVSDEALKRRYGLRELGAASRGIIVNSEVTTQAEADELARADLDRYSLKQTHMEYKYLSHLRHPSITIRMRDPWVLAQRRVIATDNILAYPSGWTSAGEFVSSLVTSEIVEQRNRVNAETYIQPIRSTVKNIGTAPQFQMRWWPMLEALVRGCYHG